MLYSASQMPSQEMPQTPIEGLAVCFTTFNSMKTFPSSLDAARMLSRQIVVVDSGSTDGTIEFCRDHGVNPQHRDWTTPTEQKGFAMSLCADAEWTLLLDSDETILEELGKSIRSNLAGADRTCTGFELNRMTWLDSKPLRHAFQPEWRLRLVRSNSAIITSDPSGTHDHLEVTTGTCQRLSGILRHDSWLDAEDMLTRGIHWGVRTGRAARRGGRVHNLCFNPGWSFLKQLFVKRAILDGWRGWVAAAGVASQTLAKHIAAMEQRGRAHEDGTDDKQYS
jgi:glycosyltransferase involved in cell wall biosynthesis